MSYCSAEEAIGGCLAKQKRMAGGVVVTVACDHRVALLAGLGLLLFQLNVTAYIALASSCISSRLPHLIHVALLAEHDITTNIRDTHSL